LIYSWPAPFSKEYEYTGVIEMVEMNASKTYEALG
jgi:hypothetical protein